MPCCCFKRSRNERIFQRTKKKLDKELDIVDLIKFIREVKLLMRSSVSYEDRKKSIKASRIYYVNSNEDDDTEMTDTVKNKTVEITSHILNPSEEKISLTKPD